MKIKSHRTMTIEDRFNEKVKGDGELMPKFRDLNINKMQQKYRF